MRFVLLFIITLFAFNSADAKYLWERTNFPESVGVVSLDCRSSETSGVYCIFAITDSLDFYKSSDNGDSWSRSNIVTALEPINVAIDNSGDFSDESVPVFVATRLGGLLVSYTEGATWEEYSEGLDSSDFQSLRVYSDGGYVVVSSDNFGLAISEIDAGQFEVDTLGLDGAKPLCFNAGQGGMYLGTDNGVYFKDEISNEWTALNQGLENKEVIDIVRSSAGPVYAATSNDGVYFLDYQVWTACNEGLADTRVSAIEGLEDIIIDIFDMSYNPVIPLYSILLGNENLGFFYQSTTDGDSEDFHWISENRELQDTSLTDLALAEAQLLFAGTSSDGVYRTTWEWVHAKVAEKKTEEGYVVYPNPCSETLYIETQSQLSFPIIVEIYNAYGEKMKTVKGSDYSANETLSLDVSDLANGLYFFKIVAGDNIITRKAIVRR